MTTPAPTTLRRQRLPGLESAGKGLKVWHVAGAAAGGSSCRDDQRRDSNVLSLLSAELGVERETISIERRCPYCHSSGHGRPTLPGQARLRLSISRGAGDTVVALAPFEVGIDIEPARSAFPVIDELLPEITTLAERQWFWAQPPAARAQSALRLWTAKEAALKLAGVGLPGGLRNVEVEPVTARVHMLGPLRLLHPRGLRVASSTLPDGAVVTVTVPGDDRTAGGAR